MNTKVTATITAEKATINAFDYDAEEIKEIDCIVRKATAEKDAIEYCKKNGLEFCEILKTVTGSVIKYELDADIYMANAIKVDKRPNGNYISRTVNISAVECLVYNSVTHKADKKTICVDTKNTDKIEAIVKRELKKDENPKRLLKVLSINTTSILYIMPVEKFIELASIAE